MRYSFLFDKKLDVDFNMKNFEILLVKFEEFLYFIVIKFLELFKVLLVLFVFLFLLFVLLVLGVLVFVEKFKILFLFVMEKKLKVVV